MWSLNINYLAAAHGAAVTYFTSQYNTSSWAAARLIDGDDSKGYTTVNGSGWASVSSSPSSPQNIIFQFSNLVQIAEVMLWNCPYDGDTKNFEIWLSGDPAAATNPTHASWVRVVAAVLPDGVNNYNQQGQPYTFDPVTARYLKFVWLTMWGTGGTYAELGSIKAYGLSRDPMNLDGVELSKFNIAGSRVGNFLGSMANSLTASDIGPVRLLSVSDGASDVLVHIDGGILSVQGTTIDRSTIGSRYRNYPGIMANSLFVGNTNPIQLPTLYSMDDDDIYIHYLPSVESVVLSQLIAGDRYRNYPGIISALMSGSHQASTDIPYLDIQIPIDPLDLADFVKGSTDRAGVLLRGLLAKEVQRVSMDLFGVASQRLLAGILTKIKNVVVADQIDITIGGHDYLVFPLDNVVTDRSGISIHKIIAGKRVVKFDVGVNIGGPIAGRVRRRGMFGRVLNSLLAGFKNNEFVARRVRGARLHNLVAGLINRGHIGAVVVPLAAGEKNAGRMIYVFFI